MIFIQSSIKDISTDDVIDWLIFFESKCQIQRLNDVYNIEKITYHLGVNAQLTIPAVVDLFTNNNSPVYSVILL